MKITHTRRIGTVILVAATLCALMSAGAQETDEEAKACALQAGMTGELLVNGDFSQ